MKKLNCYISEKLKIDKDTKIDDIIFSDEEFKKMKDLFKDIIENSYGWTIYKVETKSNGKIRIVSNIQLSSTIEGISKKICSKLKKLYPEYKIKFITDYSPSDTDSSIYLFFEK